MTWDIATAKTKLGIVGTLQDTQLQAAIDVALAVAEKYCDRQFQYAAEVASFYHVKAESIKLYRYPVEQIVSITSVSGGSNIGATDYKAHLSSGTILFKGWRNDEQIDVSYAGGYKTLPADLELALWDVFNAIWSSTPGWGAAAGTGASTASGAIKSINVPDVGKIDFDVSGGAAASSSIGGLGGYITPLASTLLERYKAESICGAG